MLDWEAAYSDNYKLLTKVRSNDEWIERFDGASTEQQGRRDVYKVPLSAYHPAIRRHRDHSTPPRSMVKARAYPTAWCPSMSCTRLISSTDMGGEEERALLCNISGLKF